MCFAVIRSYVINASTLRWVLLRKEKKPTELLFQSLTFEIQTSIGDIAGLVADHCNKENHILFGFPVCINLCLHYIVVY